jgi:hypothetical protein
MRGIIAFESSAMIPKSLSKCPNFIFLILGRELILAESQIAM